MRAKTLKSSLSILYKNYRVFEIEHPVTFHLYFSVCFLDWNSVIKYFFFTHLHLKYLTFVIDMKKTLYVSDMDGTLLNSQSIVSNTTSDIINNLSRQGALITVATARTPATVEPLLSQTQNNLPAIVMTGAALWDRNAMKYVAPQYLDLETVIEIKKRCNAHNICPFIYTLKDSGFLDVYYNGIVDDNVNRFITEREMLTLKTFHINTGIIPQNSLQNTILFFAMDEKSRIFTLAEEINQNIDCSVSCYVDIFGEDTGILEIFAPGVSKAQAVKSLAKSINAERIVVFGDNLNDIPMMQIADVSVAVGNALDEVKNIADVVIDCNDCDAVAQYIQKDFLQQNN